MFRNGLHFNTGDAHPAQRPSYTYIHLVGCFLDIGKVKNQVQKYSHCFGDLFFIVFCPLLYRRQLQLFGVQMPEFMHHKCISKCIDWFEKFKSNTKRALLLNHSH